MANDRIETSAPAPADAEAGLLAACPACAYPLRGLPVRRHCPECGLEIDRRWTILGGMDCPTNRQRRHAVRVILRIVLAVYLFLYLFAVMRTRHPVGGELLLLILVCGGLAAALLRTHHRSRGFIALGPDGLRLVPTGTRSICHSWPTVGRARYDILNESVMVRCGGRELRLRNRQYFSRATAEADRCVQAINAYPRPDQDSIAKTGSAGSSASDVTT